MGELGKAKDREDVATTPEPPETGLVRDEDLPEDLRPADNPLARDPDEDADEQGLHPDVGETPLS